MPNAPQHLRNCLTLTSLPSQTDDVYDWLTDSVEPIMYDSATSGVANREGEVSLYSTIVGGIRVKKTSIESEEW